MAVCENALHCDAANGGGETDVYYTYSTNGGATWAPPIDLTGEANDSAVFPWMVAGSPGQVDLVLYKANTGLNPNIAFYDANGNPCTNGDPGCRRPSRGRSPNRRSPS